jgi:hypothetical protein
MDAFSRVVVTGHGSKFTKHPPVAKKSGSTNSDDPFRFSLKPMKISLLLSL